MATLVCIVCGAEFDVSKKHEDHVREEHLTCYTNNCGKQFKSLYDRDAHMKCHVPCILCGEKGYKNFEEWSSHKDNHPSLGSGK